VAAAAAFAAGIAIDRAVSLPWIVWLAAGGALAAGWVVCMGRNWSWPAACLLFACGVVTGGARHHADWSTASAADLASFATDEPRLVRLTARIHDEPRIQFRPKEPWRAAWPRLDSTTALLDCRQIETANGPLPVSGRARLYVRGHLLHAAAGDEVEIHGWLQCPGGPGNPGEFDFRAFLRREGARAVVWTDHPEAVSRLAGSSAWSPVRWLSGLREESAALLSRHLGAQTQPLASSLILGDRSGLSREVRDAFAESGMMHVLAISGQNVGILALLCWLCCRILSLSERGTATVIVLVSLGYAGLTLGEPPIVRATVMVLLAAIGAPWHRQTSVVNLLAIAALLLLMWSPVDLFDVGAQLSFLAVLGMSWFAGGGFGWWRAAARRRAGTIPAERGPVRVFASTAWRFVRTGYGVTLAVWLFTLPLVAARFHLVSPIGLVINVVLMPVVVAVLWLGYAFTVCGLLFPPVASVLGPPLDLGLRFFVGLVEWGAGWRMGWFHVPSIPDWWLAGYYALLAGAVAWQHRGLASRRIATGLLLWVAAGLGAWLLPAGSTDLRVRFLSVGHGCAVLVEMPNGRTLLYDTGAIHDAVYAQQCVENALWHDHRRGIDAVVVSHADVDHFNGLPGLLNGVPVGSLHVARSFLDFRQDMVRRLCDAAAERGVPIRLIQRGDRLKIDDGVTVEVLHPPPGAPLMDDNANSVVLRIGFAGRTILLTGDLADSGLAELLKEPAQKVDVLLSPHHGSPGSNPAALAAWGRPELVVVSTGRSTALPALRERYAPGGSVLSTHEAGAVTVEVGANGELRVRHERPVAAEGS